MFYRWIDTLRPVKQITDNYIEIVTLSWENTNGDSIQIFQNTFVRTLNATIQNQAIDRPSGPAQSLCKTP